MKHLHSGKIRDLYETDDGLLLMVASDRISAFDHVLEPDIPDKGAILTQLSLWWFERLADVVPHHIAGPGPDARSMLSRPLRMVPVECVARGYLTGSGLDDYRRDGMVSGIRLPAGLEDGSRLPEPIFTPSSKAPVGQHDEPISFEQVVAEVGAETAEALRRITLAVYTRGAEIARERGIIVADTKIELGWDSDGVLTLGDEVLTPDSSRFWPADEWRPGRRQPSFDKQYVRDWLASPESGWDKSSGNPPPRLPDKVVEQTRQRYLEAYERITGTSFNG
ncbi:phosphoribosylaminoimidazolesuccinocarboxamide synthase [Nonomuraea muscovyensis]|jgi:phosphoribosylaminoimidazole-succinocarboxamide synthase|uniref:Phosphoribosylaminoimidazole-succinocarboxamide synthase n=1 Tax=Nonomuraea muscovyensis TaxID=1124761 RepID=A0A7X0C2K1_9ACTN|nr:phosphoribosylaminoimidazolesuccinocarboxamide synthase [Nonomuraea muscovyensis]MBB6346501.1 phosphoribosylaminoimidazole-succinocarboxamide synthase [Nonomuraea muscovyensis]MDF2707952.1 phosphoribosylaminoimidazolesuccinocarboxamide synthase [Nonomuraea muscovyensis]